MTDDDHVVLSPGRHGDAMAAAAASLSTADILGRIWRRDHTVWRPDPREIDNRLGWLDAPETMAAVAPELAGFAAEAAANGMDRCLLMGMGGSSLAPELFGRTFGGNGPLNLRVLDSTLPGAVRRAVDWAQPERTLFVAASKSGTTAETLSFYRYFRHLAREALGPGAADGHFAVITDPGSPLAVEGVSRGLRRVFENDPSVGGRYSALTHFGLVPAALVGVDLPRLLDRAAAAAAASGAHADPAMAPGARLGAWLGSMANSGCNKVTFLVPPEIAGLADWAEQLLAESTGKDGRGILPVVGEPRGRPADYGPDRAFVVLDLGAAEAQNTRALAQDLAEAGHPVARLRLDDAYDIGAQFFLWEMATAVAGRVMGIHPFDQPNVEAAKALAREMLGQYEATGRMPAGPPGATAADAVAAFLLEDADYVTIQAYMTPDSRLDEVLRRLRGAVMRRTGRATTVGYGPRYLHSTGQLHKGDAGLGRFLMLVDTGQPDLAIPPEDEASSGGATFGVLTLAEAVGDYRALAAAGRAILRLHLGPEPMATVEAIVDTVSKVPPAP